MIVDKSCHLIGLPAYVEPRYNHTIWQKSIGQYSAYCFSPDFGSECLQRRKKSLSVFVLDTKTKEDNKIVLQIIGFEISREQQRLLLQSRKIAKRWQTSWKTHWNNRGIKFHKFLSERSERFRPWSGQASDKVSAYNKRTNALDKNLRHGFLVKRVKKQMRSQ